MSDDSLAWYQNSLEVLSPLRFHLNEVLSQMDILITLHKVLGTPPPFSIQKYKEAQEALDKCERFFTHG